MHRGEDVVLLHSFESFEAFDAVANRVDVREHAAQPAVRYKGLSSFDCRIRNYLLGLLLGAHKQNAVTSGGDVMHEFRC